MKRILLILGATLICFVLRAQSEGYTCRYWFDKNHAQALTTTFNTSTWEAQLDVGDLSDGVHTLHLQLMAENTVSLFGIENDSLFLAVDTSLMQWSVPQSYLFLKTGNVPSSELAYQYWFDQDYSGMESGSIGNGHLLLDVDELSFGLHSLHLLLKGSNYTATQSYLFLKTDVTSNDGNSMIYHCWFDQDFEHQQSNALGAGSFLLDATDLEEGIHEVHIILEGSELTTTLSYLFMKVASIHVDDIDMSHLVYHCWFDQDFEHQQTDSIGDGHILLDANSLEDGLHTVNVLLEGSQLTTTQSYMFMKMAVEDPNSELHYICWFDQDYENVQTGLLGSGIFELEAGDLPNGIHTVNIQLDNGTLTAPLCYMFYKQPLGGYGVARWEYWVNDEFENRNSTIFPASLDTLEIITLLPVGHPELRSSCFQFHPNGDAPYINAKNQITFRVWDSENRFFDQSAFFVDEQVQHNIVAQVFERNTTETFAAPHNNQIQWFKLDAAVGDSLAFVADKACTMQLFAPSGEEIYTVSASDAVVFGGCHAWEEGTYYLAVHDQTGSGETISVTYNWVYRYAVLVYDVHVVGNGGCSTITIKGNGFNSLLDVYLVNEQNDTIQPLDIGHESNTTTTVTFNFYQVNLGLFDAVFQFYDETIRINDALEVQEPINIVLSSTVSFPSRYLRNTVVTYTYTITNNGNMSAYAVPIYLYVSTESIECISHVELEGIALMEFKDYFDMDSLTQEEKQLITNWSEGKGDDHYFFKVYGVDELTEDTILIRSNYFYINLAPYETKEIKIKLTSDCSNDVWMTIPAVAGYDYPYPPFVENGWGSSSGSGGSGGSGGTGGSGGSGGTGGSGGSGGSGGTGGSGGSGGSGNSGGTGNSGDTGGSGNSGDSGNSGGSGSSNGYCCSQEKIQCTLDNLCNMMDAADLLGLGSDLASCVCGTLQNANSFISGIICEGESPLDAFRNLPSFWGTMLSCAVAICPAGKIKAVLNAADNLMDAWTLTDLLTPPARGRDIGTDVSSCVSEWTKIKPGCPPPPETGGESTPVNSLDPNDIHGYLSESGSHYMRQEIQNIHYEIEFENDTTLASAAAHTIIVRDTLDATKFDLSSLAAHSVTIGDKRLELNGEQNFARTLDMRPELYVIAQINQEYDPNTGIVVWTIQSLDPMTMEPTDNPHQGVLPVNYFGDGVGFIDYSVNLKAPFEDGTQVSNRAGIVFDQEEVIMTPTWTNTVDAVPPTSQMVEVTPVADSLVFVFNSEDNRSGMWYHTLYYRNDFTEMEWEIRKTMILENRFPMKLDDLQTTEYYVVAVDSAGNVEPKEQLEEYVFSLEDYNYYNVTVVAPEGLGTTTGSGTYVENSDITIEAIPAEGYHFTQWNDGNTENPRTIHVMQNLTLTAQFAINRYLVEVVSDDNNMGSVTGGAEYNHGTQVTVVAEANQGFHFMYWLENDTIASLDAVFNFVVTCPRSLTAVFATGNGNQISYTESFSAGWNWFSSFVEYKANTLSLFENDLSTASTSASIKSQRDGFATLENNTWAGTLSSLFNEQMYLVSVNQDAELAISGLRVNPQIHPVTLEPGWNWIGYMSPITMSLDESLASITPSENDVIKGQTGFSTYIEENGWMGSLNAMKPGQGYIYLNNSTSETTLVYPQTSRGYIEEAYTPKHWSTNAHRFPTNLTMMVTLDENEFRLADGLYEIGAFVNGECRGSARIQYLESLGNHVAFLTVCGEEGEEVSFRLFDVASNKVLDVIANEQIVYHADAVHGSLKAPMMLHFRNTGVNDEHHEVSLFPNPTTGKVTVKAVGMNRLTVTDVLGQVVSDTEVNADQIELNLSNCESGLYMIHVNTDTFTVVRRFVLAK